ncbi:hypothetical protein CYY_007358 [Polysphondylium violaceum]|uniref:Transmembrane protein n=1 Tax=Polysphondylium violaceum TaxID=133409 RepID=A0A8J4V2A1_9MYCE|nr:hypothetical protein CYY_007358 [Polysphondylium violaceum]
MEPTSSYGNSNYNSGFNNPNQPFWARQTSPVVTDSTPLLVSDTDLEDRRHHKKKKGGCTAETFCVRLIMLLFFLGSAALAIIGLYHYSYVKKKQVDLTAVLWWVAAGIVLFVLFIGIIARKCRC